MDVNKIKIKRCSQSEINTIKNKNNIIEKECNLLFNNIIDDLVKTLHLHSCNGKYSSEVIADLKNVKSISEKYLKKYNIYNLAIDTLLTSLICLKNYGALYSIDLMIKEYPEIKTLIGGIFYLTFNKIKQLESNIININDCYISCDNILSVKEMDLFKRKLINLYIDGEISKKEFIHFKNNLKIKNNLAHIN